MGHDAKEPYIVPDYRKYKVEMAPELVKLQTRLAKLGLKDPWIRNEVWRFNPKEFGAVTKWLIFRKMILKGFLSGTSAAIITVAVTSWLWPSNNHHHHKDDHQHETAH